MKVFCSLGVCGPLKPAKKLLVPRQRRLHAISDTISEGPEGLSVDHGALPAKASGDGGPAFDTGSGEAASLPDGSQAPRRSGARTLLQKHSSKPTGFKLAPEVRASIAERNGLDVRLYELAKRRLHEAHDEATKR